MIDFPKVAVVILNWNGKYYLERFLPSVYNSSYPNLTFVIGDNASTDDSVEFIKKTYPKITLIQNDKNYGFAGGYNRILAQVEADYFIILNSDVEVSPNWIEPIIQAMESDSKVVAAQPKILSSLNPDQFEYAGAAGGFIDKYGYPFCRGRIFENLEVDLGQYNDPKSIFWASGAALFIKSKIWKESGGFDEDFFAHMEEIDLCWRLKRMGYTIKYYPFSEVFHVGGGALSKENPFKTYLNFRNNLMMLQKNLPSQQVYLRLFLRLWLDLFALLRFYLKGQFKDAFAVHRAHGYFFRHFIKNNKKRKLHTTNFKVSELYLKSIVWDYFITGINKFNQLDYKNFSKNSD
jgi:GT2 family glycosyltransferase